MSPETRSRPWLTALVFLGCTAGALIVGLMGASVMQRRDEAQVAPPQVPIAAMEVDSAKWGVNFPREYGRYLSMGASTTVTKYGGAAPRDLLAEDPANVILFAGYPFAKDYNQARGHLSAIVDVTGTGRVNANTPATCWTCKSTDVPRLIDKMGAEAFYGSSFADLKSEVTHPIGCLDCHDPETLALRISRPALTEALERQGRDLSQISHQEMRSLVCAQCHVEYHFKGDHKYLTFPWDKGTDVESIASYYDETGFKDWVHAISGTPMVKMQHPDFEMYSTGVHAYRDVSCADCHMPYRTEGGAKFTDHYVQSPLLNVANSCAVCHRWGEAEIKARVEGIQDKVREGRTRTEAALARAHFDIAASMQAGATDPELEASRHLVREAQLRWDYVAANNGMGFHSPQETMRILGEAGDLAQQARVETVRILARHGIVEPVVYPDFDTKRKAQDLIQLFIEGKGPSLLPGQ